MVIGPGIFKAPSIVASNSSSVTEFLLAWLLGGGVSLCGALVYAELSTRHPDSGGEYAFLRSLGRGVAFMFAWSRMTVIQTGAIAAVAAVFGAYAAEIWPLGAKGSLIYAAAAVVGLTALNLVGVVGSQRLHRVVQWLVFSGLVVIAISGFIVGFGEERPTTLGIPVASGSSFGLAMVFVLLTYGGWNEAAYLAGEVEDARRNMRHILVGGTAVVTVLYLLVNLSYLAALGLDGMSQSNAVAADVLRAVAGETGARLVSCVICLASLTSMNAAIFTGARTTYALGRDFTQLAPLGRWVATRGAPVNALLLQGGLTLIVVAASGLMPDGFTAMIAYTAPVFWTFFLLTSLTLFVMRRRDPVQPAFGVPFYPLVPAAFCAACAYMLWSSVEHVRSSAELRIPVLAGLAVMALGIPFYFLSRGRAGAVPDRPGA